MKKYKSISAEIETYKKIKYLSEKEEISIKELLEKLVNVYTKNYKLLKDDTDEKIDNFSEKILSSIEIKLERISKREANRVIGFVKTNDKYIRDLNSDFHYCYGLKGGFSSENPLVRNYKSAYNFVKNAIKINIGNNSEKDFNDFLRKNLSNQDMLFYNLNIQQIQSIEDKEW